VTEAQFKVPSEEAAERFDPESMHDSMIEAEHIARYRWACQMARGCRVLDAGCGLGYGAAMMRAAGAAEVVGIDISEQTIARARHEMPEGVQLQVGDLRSLAFDDSSFDVVTCFEAIEHVEPAERVLDELHRVLGREGVILISSPNRGVYTEGNPHHVHEFTRDELVETIGRQFANVAVRGQRTWIASSVFDDEATRAKDAALELAEVRKLSSEDPGGEVYTLVAASNGRLPPDAGLVTLTAPVELRRWERLWQEQREVMDAQADYLRELDVERAALRERLLYAERQLAALPTLRRETEDLATAVEELHRERNLLSEDRERLLHRYNIAMGSKSWRLTEPLRRIGALFRG
jgi:ubiquinone/menaquinone biosynthesis C-methylase UbiE